MGQAGTHVILPSTYKGSPRDNIQRYCDAMAVVRELGKPSYFITMTCNPEWKEIVDHLPNGLEAHDCPDLVARVFNMKLNALLNDLLKKNVMGKVKGHTYVIEFQKRGLPHAHILMIMVDQDDPKCPEQYDCAVTAEFHDDPEVRQVQAKRMYHRCRKSCENDTGRGGKCGCTKGYPKPFRDHTSDGNDSYPEYRRRSPENGGNTFKKMSKNGKEILEVLDNRRVVPHNVYLLMKYRCHINVEICNSITAVKYLYKYVYKGHDKVMYGMKAKTANQHDLPDDTVSQRGPARDEIKEFVEARYCSTSEACWRTLEFSMGQMKPRVQRLNVHTEEGHQITFTADEDETEQKLKDSQVTHLTAFFMLCLEEKQKYNQNNPMGPDPYKDGNPPARDLLYKDVAKYYKWVSKNKDTGINAHWKRRKKKENNTVGRIRQVAPSMECKELFHLRLLLNSKKGPTGFEDLS